MSAPITGVLLAAGRARRYGTDKLLAPLPDGQAVGLAAAAHLARAVPEVLVVLRTGDDAVAAAFRGAGYRTMVCADAASGMAHSLACGVAASADSRAWVIALADMPRVAPATIAALVAVFEAGHGIVVPRHRDRCGLPVVFGADYGAALRALRGDAGARTVIDAHPEAVCYVDTADAGVLLDIDTPGDLQQMRGES